jgi:hypothetical protein
MPENVPQIKFDPHGKKLVVITYDPSGTRFRGATGGPDEGEFTFVAERTGKYRVEVAASDKTVAGASTITTEKIVTLAARLVPAKPLRESPRIRYCARANMFRS